MLKAVIIEDEKRSRETLTGLIKLYCNQVELIGEADGVHSGLKLIRDKNPDLVFLDIQMPDGSGFKLLELLGNIKFDVIFTTAYDQFAIKAFKYSALDYLLKPIYPDDLIEAVKKALDKKEKLNLKPNIDTLLDNIKKPENEPPKIVLSTSDKINIVKINEIIRCESDNYYTIYYFVNGGKLLVSKTLKENEEMLSEHNFIRPHKSHLVNVAHIKGYLKSDGGYIIMSDESRIPVSRRKKEKILNIINHI
jgi:two-component system LytT family response regulator